MGRNCSRISSGSEEPSEWWFRHSEVSEPELLGTCSLTNTVRMYLIVMCRAGHGIRELRPSSALASSHPFVPSPLVRPLGSPHHPCLAFACKHERERTVRFCSHLYKSAALPFAPSPPPSTLVPSQTIPPARAVPTRSHHPHLFTPSASPHPLFTFAFACECGTPIRALATTCSRRPARRAIPTRSRHPHLRLFAPSASAHYPRLPRPPA